MKQALYSEFEYFPLLRKQVELMEKFKDQVSLEKKDQVQKVLNAINVFEQGKHNWETPLQALLSPVSDLERMAEGEAVAPEILAFLRKQKVMLKPFPIMPTLKILNEEIEALKSKAESKRKVK